MNSRKEIQEEITLLLAEKRTSLAVFRTAIAIFTLPLSVFTILTATSRYYNPAQSIHLIAPIVFISSVLVVFGLYPTGLTNVFVPTVDSLMSLI